MTKTWTRTILAAVAVAIVIGVALVMFHGPAEAQGKAKDGGGSHYSVIETNGQNLLVTDNRSNTLYYYSIDKEEKIGAPLKLRASLDLSQVGKPEITITPINPQK